jgi:hypothetical protein
MATATVRVSKPAKQKGRPVAGRPLTNFINSNDNSSSTTDLRIQRLRLLGIIGARAQLLAEMAWGMSHG